MNFVETTVLVASAQDFHPKHAQSVDLVASLGPHNGVTAAHALSEFYAITTGLPKGKRLSPREGERFVESFRRRFLVVALDAEETTREILMSVSRGVAGGAIYDALILACARKSRASTIYTLNLRDFHRIAPDLASITREP
jgi:predicted nucleic acid-binding protein